MDKKLIIRKRCYYVDYLNRVVRVTNEKVWYSGDREKTWTCAVNFTSMGSDTMKSKKCWSALGLTKKDFVRKANKEEILEFKFHQSQIFNS